MSTSQAPQESPINVELQKEHYLLQRLVGDWIYEGAASMDPDKPPVACKGTECVRSLGGLWILAEGEGEMPDGGPATTLITLGYDPQKKRFVGTFVGSMMTNLWVYDGELDNTEKVLTLNSEGPDFAVAGKTARYKDVIEFNTDDHRVMTSHTLGDDGQWHGFMRVSYRRKK
jgi:hypothetical protein